MSSTSSTKNSTPKDKKPKGVGKEKHPKDIKSALKPQQETKAVTTKVTPPHREKKGKVVAFDSDKQSYCISDLAKHYGITTSLRPCTTKCRYTHYDQLPKTLTKAEILPAVQELTTKLGLTLKHFNRFFALLMACIYHIS